MLRVMYWVILFQQLLSSTTHIAARGAAMHGDPLFIVLMRCLIAGGVFVLLTLIIPRSRVPIQKADIPLLLLLGFINIPVNQVLYIVGLRYTIAPNAALAYAMTPVFVLLISVVWHKERVTLQKIMGIVIALVGVLLVLFEKGLNFHSEYVLGNVLEFFAAFTWALYSVVGRSVSLKYGAMQGVTMSMVVGLLLYAPLYPLLRLFIPAIEQPVTPALWGEITYLALVATNASFFLWFYAMTKVDASKVAVFMNLQPIIATLITMVLWGTMPTPIFLIGGSIVILGVIITQRQ